MRVPQGSFPASEIGNASSHRSGTPVPARTLKTPVVAAVPRMVLRNMTCRDSPSASGVGLVSLRARPDVAQAARPDYYPGLRDTVGWSMQAGVPSETQPHLQRIAAGQALMQSLMPGLDAQLRDVLAVHEARRATLGQLDAQLVAQTLRVTGGAKEAERKNVRLLELAAARHEQWLQGEDAAQAARAEAKPYMGRLLYRLQTRHGCASGRRADRITIDDSLQGSVDPRQLRSWARCFYRLAGPNAPVAGRLSFVKNQARPCFDAARGEVNLGARPDARTVFHELAHAMETDVFDLMQDAESWRQARAEVAHGHSEPAPLVELCPGARYGAEEQAMQDHFISPYVGKVYEIFGSEVLSMGLEHFVSAGRMLLLYEQDPEHFFFVMGALEEVEP